MSWPGHIQDAGRHPLAVPSRHRHRADHPRGHRHPGARRSSMALPQKPIEGVSMAYTWDKANANARVQTRHPILRNDRQPRHLSRWLGRGHRPAAHAMGERSAGSCPMCSPPTNGNCITSTRTYSQNTDLAADESRQAQGTAGSLPGRGGEIQVFPLANRLPPADAHARVRISPPGAHVFTYSGESSGARRGRRAEHPRTSPTPSPPKWKFPRAVATA